RRVATVDPAGLGRLMRTHIRYSELGSCQLTVICRGVPGSSRVVGARLLHVPDRLGRSASPIAGPRANDRIGRSIIDMCKVSDRGLRLVQKAQCDPAWHEAGFGA